MKWFEIFAEVLPFVFKLVPALRAHQQTAVDATTTLADAATLGPVTRTNIKATIGTLVSDGVRVANDELVAAGKSPIDHAAVVNAAGDAVTTALAITDVFHAAHGEGDAPAHGS